MKRLLKANAVMILLFSSLLTYFTFKNNDTVYWNQWGRSEISKEIYLRNTGYSGEDLFHLLTNLAEEEHVNIIKTDYLEEGNSTKVVKSIYITNNEDNPMNEITLSEAYEFEANQNHTNEYYSTKKSEDQNIKAQIADPFDDDHVEIWTLKRFQEKQGNLDGTYRIRAAHNEAIQSFVEELAKRSGISIDELTTQTAFTGTMQSPLETISSIAVIISLILFCILSIFYAINNIKKIGVMKLNGYSNWHIWESLIVNVIYTMIAAGLFLDIMMLFVLENVTRDFILSLIVIQIVFVAVLMLISSGIYLIIKQNTINNLIKNKRPVRVITSISYMVKSLLLFASISIIVFISAGFHDIRLEYHRLKQWNDVGDLAVLVNVDIGNDQASFSQGAMDLQNDFAEYYHELNQKGAIYIDVQEFIPHVQFKTNYVEATNSYDYVDYFDQTAVPLEYRNINFLVNPNYLLNYPLKDVNGNVIKVGEDDRRTILIPDTMSEMKNEIISIYTSKYKDRLLSDARKTGSEIANIDDIKINAILYQADPNGYFTFHPDYEESNDKAYAPIFEVANEQSMTSSEKGDIVVQGLDSPLKLKLDGMTSTEYNQQVNDVTKAYHLDDNSLRYMTIKEVFGNEIESLEQACQQYIIATIICIFTMILITIQLTQMLIETEKKKYCIQKLNGYRFTDRFRKILILNSVMEIFIAAAAILISPSLLNTELNPASLIVIIPLLLLNFILICCLLRYFENKNLTQIVKGE